MSAMCLAVIALAALAVAPVTSVSHNDAVHLGCFKTNLVDTQRSYYMVNESLSWENGISACIHRYTTHVGVQAVNRLPSKSYFFCGNDLPEHSVKLKDSDCARCDSKDRHCGGPQSISIYKIRDSTPLVILVASFGGINLLEVDGSHTNSNLIHTLQSVEQITNFYSRDEIFSVAILDASIYKFFFDHQIQEYSTPSPFEADQFWFGFAVDWLHETLYYCKKDGIVEYVMKNETTRYLYAINSWCISLAIDPYTRTLFTVFYNGTLSAFSLLTLSYRTYTGGMHGLHDAERVAVDCESQLIYVATKLTLGNGKYNLVQMDYNDTNLNILHKDIEHGYTYGLDVFNGTVFWTEYSESTKNSSIYSCKLSPTCNPENIKRLYTTDTEINDIVVYHPVRQTPSQRYLCNTARCTHGCSRRTLFTTQCTCPEGLILDSDNATCQASESVTTEAVNITSTPSQVTPVHVGCFKTNLVDTDRSYYMRIHDIGIYHPVKQKPTERYLCKSAGCSHCCTRATLFTAKCTCPEGLILGPDNAKCQVIEGDYCIIQESLQIDYKPDKGFCLWVSPPDNGINFRQCSAGLCRGISGSRTRNCTARFTRCENHYVLTGGLERDSCVDGKWTTEGHKCICCGESNGLFNRIHKGNVSSSGEFPWVAALYRLNKSQKWDQVCGGTLVSPSLVLTAAHCLASGEMKLKANNLQVGLGKLNRSYYQQEEFSFMSNVTEIVQQERYQGHEHFFELDIALLVLSSSVVTGKYIMPACVDWDAAMEPKHNEVGYLAGWGTNENQTSSDVLMWAYQTYTRYNECLLLLEQHDRRIITLDKFCVTPVDGVGLADQGDSGGGLTMLRDGAHYVYGVVSVKPTSNSTNVRLFTNVLNDGHIAWLRRQWQRLLLNR